jgi:hypothetical protein
MTPKVLTIRQPWAGLILLSLKDIENRTWSTSYRGKLIIHASADMRDHEWMSARVRCQSMGLKFPDGDMLLGNTGALLGVVTLTDILPPAPDAVGWRVPVNYGWVLAEPVIFPTPIPIKGKLGLWNLPADTQLPDSIRKLVES